MDVRVPRPQRSQAFIGRDMTCGNAYTCYANLPRASTAWLYVSVRPLYAEDRMPGLTHLLSGPYGILALIIGFVIAVVIHEYAHARVAYVLGDTTAADIGRMTLNPARHVDPIGTVLVPLLLLVTSGFVFGWAKPVPVDPRNFRFPRRDSLLTAFAGPVANVATAAAFGLLTQVLPAGTRLPALTAVIVLINLTLAFFNLIPIPPLDGSSILTYLLGRQPLLLLQLQRQGFFLLLLLLLLDSVTGGRILGTFVGFPVSALARAFLGR